MLPNLKKMDTFLNGKKYAAGNSLTYVDFTLFEILEELKTFDQESFGAFTNLMNYVDNFTEIPQIKVLNSLTYLKAYKSSERFKERPFHTNPGYANWG